MLIPDSKRNVVSFFENYAECFPVNGVYLHGEILKFTEIDTFFVTKSSECSLINDSDEAIFDLDVCVSKIIKGQELEIKKATAYIWKNKVLNVPRGLVVLKDNNNDNDYARNKFKNKDMIL